MTQSSTKGILGCLFQHWSVVQRSEILAGEWAMKLYSAVHKENINDKTLMIKTRLGTCVLSYVFCDFDK